MAEWSNAHDSKSCYGQLYGGSNPSLCAIISPQAFACGDVISWRENEGFEGRQAKHCFAQVGGLYRRLDSN